MFATPVTVCGSSEPRSAGIAARRVALRSILLSEDACVAPAAAVPEDVDVLSSPPHATSHAAESVPPSSTPRLIALRRLNRPRRAARHSFLLTIPLLLRSDHSSPPLLVGRSAHCA